MFLGSMGTQAVPLHVGVGIKLSIFCLVLALSLTDLVSSQLHVNYHVESLDDTRNALLTYSSKPGASSKNTTPSNSFLRTVDEIEKSVYSSQALRSFYVQSPARLKKIEGIIKLAAKQGSHQFIRQSLGHALYTTIEIEKKKSAIHRKKRCSLCANAMKKFIKTIEKEIGREKFEKFVGTSKKGNKATLMFAIDDTGSMGNDIQSAKDIAKFIIEYPRPNLKVDYILSPFNDPESGRAIKLETGKNNEFIRRIELLRASGGGDCPEMTFKGIIEALKKGPENDSPLYVFTDAPPKDANKANIEDATIRAKGAGINIYFFATIGCGDPGSVKPFHDLARDTCGQVFVLPKHGYDLSKMKKVAKDLLGGTTCSGGIGSFFKKKRSVSDSIYKLLVDDTMEKIIVSVSSEYSGAKIDLKDPLGTSITGSGKTTISKVTIFEADNPKAGIWQLLVPTAAGKHTYLLKGSSKTNLAFDFIFVIPRHQGSPIPITYPLKGKNAHVILILRGADKVQAGSLNLDILSADGKFLNTASVRAVGAGGTHFSASFATPTVPFKMQLNGKTKKNHNFERNSQSTVNPSHVVVRVLYARNEFTVPKSRSEVIWFFIYNTGATEKFKLKVEVTSKFKAQYSTSPIRVYQDRLAFISIRFTAMPSAVPGSAEDVLVTVTGQASKVSASYIVSLMVA